MTGWLQFRAGERAHLVAGTSGPLHLIHCGISYHANTGKENPRAKKCGACLRVAGRVRVWPRPGPWLADGGHE